MILSDLCSLICGSETIKVVSGCDSVCLYFGLFDDFPLSKYLDSNVIYIACSDNVLLIRLY